MKFLLVILSFLLIGLPLNSHQIFLSVIEINDAKPEKLNIVVQFFADDLDETFYHDTEKKLYLCSDKEDKESGQKVFRYIKDHLKIKVNGVAKKLHFIKKESINQFDTRGLQNLFKCHIDIKTAKPKSIEIESDMLIKYFDSQSNIFRMKIGGKAKSVVLTKKKQYDKVTF